jgi:hypothetical protein
MDYIEVTESQFLYQYLIKIFPFSFCTVVDTQNLNIKTISNFETDSWINDEFNHVNGWRPSNADMQKHSFWQKGNFPFDAIDYNLKEYCGVHIRLGDYRSTGVIKLLPWSYYKKAMSKIIKVSRIKEIKFLIFSDEPDWVLKVYPKLSRYNIQFIYEKHPKKVLKMLASTKYLILANSTFSYWGYYFGNHFKIYAPKPFYIKQYLWGRNLWSNTEIKNKKINLISYSRFLTIWYIFVRILNRTKYNLKNFYSSFFDLIKTKINGLI